MARVVKSPPADARDAGLIPGLGRSPGGGNGILLQYSCLENSMGRGTADVNIVVREKNKHTKNALLILLLLP